MPRQRIRWIAVVLPIVAGLALLAWSVRPDPGAAREPVGLFTSLPLIWAETEDPRQLLDQRQARHRAKIAFDALGPIRPLDTLEHLDGSLKRMIIAQPRPLSPAENVALDRWLREGGRVLLFADPLLTEPSVYALGDPRRPQDVVLLSPILSHWGLELVFDDQQPGGVRTIAVAGSALPVDLAGGWIVHGGKCRLEGEGVLVTCQVGRGRLVALADAEVLAAHDPGQLRQNALANLLRRSFGQP